MIYTLLSRNFGAEIYALFVFLCDWKADSANFFAFSMYGLDINDQGDEHPSFDIESQESNTINFTKVEILSILSISLELN